MRSRSLDDDFRTHYGSGVETERLLRGTSRLEFHRTKQIMLRQLPKKKNATILDIGGGPGYYSRWLARMGYSVHLVDILPLHIQQARMMEKQSKNPLASISLGDARKLDFLDQYAEAILLFGPMYHLIRRKERMVALSEAFRVLKPSGIIFVAAVSRFASALDGSFSGFIRDPEFMKIVKQDLENGQHRNPTNKVEYFTTAFFHHPSELESEMREAKFRAVQILAVTGFAWLLPKFGEYWEKPELKARLLTILERIETEPSIIGMSDHLLGIGRKGK
jgi:ubiquinone/menaquinone biosynthesis C-methylase UbiE